MKRVIAVVAITAGVLAGPAQATVSDGTYVGVIDLAGNMQFNVANKTVYKFKWSNMRIQCGNQIYHVTGALNRHANIQHGTFTMVGQDGQGAHVRVGGIFSGAKARGYLRVFGSRVVTTSGTRHNCDSFKQRWDAKL